MPTILGKERQDCNTHIQLVDEVVVLVPLKSFEHGLVKTQPFRQYYGAS